MHFEGAPCLYFDADFIYWFSHVSPLFAEPRKQTSQQPMKSIYCSPRLSVLSGSTNLCSIKRSRYLARKEKTASTKNLGDRVEVRIRDNGTGMTSDVKEKMFNPFFTTKPTGEGTGLGLSISHDVIVKQHAGTIEVDTQPGEFTEIRIVLPRTPAFV